VLGKVPADILDRAIRPLPPGHPTYIPQGDDIDVFLHLFCHDHTFNVLLRQLRRFGCVTTALFVLIMTHWGTRRFWSHAFASRIFLPLLSLLIFFTLFC
jgi:hypothetical protein